MVWNPVEPAWKRSCWYSRNNGASKRSISFGKDKVRWLQAFRLQVNTQLFWVSFHRSAATFSFRLDSLLRDEEQKGHGDTPGMMRGAFEYWIIEILLKDELSIFLVDA